MRSLSSLTSKLASVAFISCSISFFASFALFTNPASAAPVDFHGRFHASGEVQPLVRQTIDMVDMRQIGSDQQLQNLRAAGALCQAQPSDVYRCVTNLNAAHVPSSSLQQAAARNQNLWIEFGGILAPAQQVNNSDRLKEWTVSQAGTWSGGAFKTYRYLELPGLAKIVVDGVSENGVSQELWLNVLGFEHQLVVFDTVVVVESRWRFHQDMVQVVLKPQVP